MSTRSSVDESSVLQCIAELGDVGKADTVYRDLYVMRARTLLGPVLSPEEYDRQTRQRVTIQELPREIQRAVERGDWSGVKELGRRLEDLRRTADDKRRVMEQAQTIYADEEVRLDPFSPGLHPFTGIAAPAQASLREQAIERLARLERADAPWRDFYESRRRALQALALTPEEAGAAAPEMDSRESAITALKSGDIARLTALADAMLRTSAPTPAAASGGRERPSAAVSAAPDLSFAFSEQTIQGARRLGLAPRHLVSQAEFASLRAYAWHPCIASDPSGQIGVKDVPLPAGASEGIRERLEMLMIHPLVNSGGARHLPRLGAEDILVEDFPDPGETDRPPVSPLLTALGLANRRGVPRDAIERALLARGHALLEKELGLDPRAFRLVCIPPDVHLRLGEAQGWGRHATWTHFDGYLVMANGRLRALVGGDVRFGGIYHLLSIGRDYDSEKLIVRLAVVRRERMTAWPS